MILYNTSKGICDFLSFVVFFTASTDQVTVEMNAENITINEGGIGTVGVYNDNRTGKYSVNTVLIIHHQNRFQYFYQYVDNNKSKPTIDFQLVNLFLVRRFVTQTEPHHQLHFRNKLKKQ